jgi:Flp pilus assembly protein TadG
MATIIAVAFQGIIFLLVQCTPISWYWDKSTGSGSCVSSAAIRGNTIATNFTAAVTDVYSAVLPMILLWNVQMDLRSKFLVCIMLSLGAL